MISTPRDATAEERALCGLNFQIALPDRIGGDTPFILLAHGRTGDRKVMWTFSRAFHGLRPVAISLEAPFDDPDGGFCWWPHRSGSGDTTQAKTPLEDITDACVRLERFAKAAGRLFFQSETKPVSALGFSQGGALLLSALLRAHVPFRAVASLSAFLPRAVAAPYDQGLEAVDSPLPDIFFYHGRKDPIVPAHAAQLAQQFFAERGARTKLVMDDTKHKVSLTGMREIERWLSALLS